MGLLFGFAAASKAAARQSEVSALACAAAWSPGEFALATALPVGRGLLVQSLVQLQKGQLRFHPEGVLSFQLSGAIALAALLFESLDVQRGCGSVVTAR